MNDSIKWWLGDWSEDFEKNKDILENLDLEAESRFDAKVIEYMSKYPVIPGHDFDHHKRVRAFTTIIGVANDESIQNIQTCRYGAMLHDQLKETGRGGKGDHNWVELRKLTKKLMENAKIDERYVPKVTDIIEEHEIDNPSKRSGIGNILYEGDTVDITFLPRCFDVAQSLPHLYPTMDRVIEDYTRYQVNPSKPITSAGERMFEVGKTWALPTLEKLRVKLGSRNLEPYFQFINTNWRKNIERTPEILKETLDTYKEVIPRYEINL